MIAQIPADVVSLGNMSYDQRVPYGPSYQAARLAMHAFLEKIAHWLTLKGKFSMYENPWRVLAHQN